MATNRPTQEKVGARKVIDFMQRSELVKMDMPVHELVRGVSDLGDVAGYVIAWEKYVLVIGFEADRVSLPEVNR